MIPLVMHLPVANIVFAGLQRSSRCTEHLVLSTVDVEYPSTQTAPGQASRPPFTSRLNSCTRSQTQKCGINITYV